MTLSSRTFILLLVTVLAFSGCVEDNGPETDADTAPPVDEGEDQVTDEDDTTEEESAPTYEPCAWEDVAACKVFDLTADMLSMALEWQPIGDNLIVSGGDPHGAGEPFDDGHALYVTPMLDEEWGRSIEFPATNPVIRTVGDGTYLAALDMDDFLTLSTDNEVIDRHRFDMTHDMWTSPTTNQALVEIDAFPAVHLSLVDLDEGSATTYQLGEDWGIESGPDTGVFLEDGDRVVVPVNDYSGHGAMSCYWLDIDTVSEEAALEPRECEHRAIHAIEEDTIVSKGDDTVVLFDESFTVTSEKSVPDLSWMHVFDEDAILAVASHGDSDDRSYTTHLLGAGLDDVARFEGSVTTGALAPSPVHAACVGIGEGGQATVVDRDGEALADLDTGHENAQLVHVACSPSGEEVAAMVHHPEMDGIEVAVFKLAM